mmetsp:Transcript_8280/g.20886  ORF Transcript_8280/g.20886 Transcript_8280/m.20886 type:complete len:443 (+) Transcript_8280:128-1456(+)
MRRDCNPPRLALRGFRDWTVRSLLAALVNLLEEELEDAPRQIGLLDVRAHRHDLVVRLLLVLAVKILQSEVLVHLTNRELLGGIYLALAVMVLQVLFLLWAAQVVEGVAEQPPALFVLDVGANLSQLLRRCERVQVVILRLKVHPHVDQRFSRRIESFAVVDSCHDHAQRYRAVERIKGGLVLHDQGPPVQGEVVQTDIHAQQIQKLAAFGLERCLEEEVDQLGVVWLSPKVAFQCPEDEHFDHESIVYRDLLHMLMLVPTKLPSACLGIVHEIVRDQQPCLEPFDAPTQHRELCERVTVHRAAFLLQDLRPARHHHETSVHLAALHVEVEAILDPLHFPLRQLADIRQLADVLFDELITNCHERLLLIRQVVHGVRRPGVVPARRRRPLCGRESDLRLAGRTRQCRLQQYAKRHRDGHDHHGRQGLDDLEVCDKHAGGRGQ